VVILAPVDTLLDVGDTIIFTVTTSGDTPQTFDWYHGVDLVFSETNSDHTSSYTLVNAQEVDSGEWSVDITSEDCGPTETVFQVTVGECPVILTSPTNQNLTVGDDVVLTVTTAGETPQTYNWYRGVTLVFTESNSVNQSDFSITDAQLTDAGSYRVEVVYGDDPLCDVDEAFFSVAVEEGDEFSWDLTWDAPTIYNSNPTPGSSSSTLTADQFITSVTCPAWPGAQLGGQGIACHGEQTYTGPLVSCHLQLVVVGPGTVVSNTILAPITVKVDSVEVFNSGYAVDTTGTFDFDFDLPISVAALIEVDLGMLLVVCDPGVGCGGVQETFSWNGTLSVNP
jgi:hypothetical protein